MFYGKDLCSSPGSIFCTRCVAYSKKLSFNKTDRKRSIMATMEADTDLYLGTQRLDQSMDEFYKTFTAHVDTIDSNVGIAGFHNGVYNKHMLALWDRDLVTANSLGAMSPAEKTALEFFLQKEVTGAAARSTLRASSSSW